MIGTDSHTPNAGGLGMMAIGVGGADAVDVMVGLPWELRMPKVLGVRLSGQLSGWASPKDVILRLAGLLTVRGGTGFILEYFGEGVESLSCTGMATICNMGAEVGATTSVFPFTAKQAEYLRATGRSAIAEAASRHASLLRADAGTAGEHYDEVIEVDLSALEPHINGPFTPDRAHAVSALPAAIAAHGWPGKLSAALIGSCTNSSYEDMTRAAHVVRQAQAQGLTKTRVPLYVTPGSAQIRATLDRDGLTALFESAGGVVLANACGPCIGQWKRSDGTQGKANSIVSSFNRNFTGRNDGNNATHHFMASPEIVTALAFSGELGFDPQRGELSAPSGAVFRLDAPRGEDLPGAGFAAPGEGGYVAPAADGSGVEIRVDPRSDRLQLLSGYAPFSVARFRNMRVLVKVQGKCTTDHISAAGKWLKYKGHLDNISENTLIGAVNAYTGKTNSTLNALTGEYEAIPAVAKAYKAAGVPWVVVAETNYGEGSAREHAAMQPRHLGGVAVVCKSFARIHETNLKKQGVLPLTFEDPSDFDKIGERDVVSLEGVEALLEAPVTAKVVLRAVSPSGGARTMALRHTMNAAQVAWLKAGSALEAIAKQGKH
eukprot:TRINITY_DN2490_c0_g2_i1.p2 TRINITY_DN2490_c0_g2~~TRINITY_DN2490_c0_g2_i1.p2  ORF type:complete len:603 (+),score=142.93 TRINITY_DN2490_c0_g2_i1:614-2422(+)